MAALPITQCAAGIARAKVAAVNHVGGDSVSGQAPQHDDHSIVTEPSLKRHCEYASVGQNLIPGRHSCISLQSPGPEVAGVRRRHIHGQAPGSNLPAMTDHQVDGATGPQSSGRTIFSG